MTLLPSNVRLQSKFHSYGSFVYTASLSGGESVFATYSLQPGETAIGIVAVGLGTSLTPYTYNNLTVGVTPLGTGRLTCDTITSASALSPTLDGLGLTTTFQITNNSGSAFTIQAFAVLRINTSSSTNLSMYYSLSGFTVKYI